MTAMRLAEFARHIIRESWDRCELDSEFIQNTAEECGLVVEIPYDPATHTLWGEEYGYEPGDPIYVFSDELKAALAKEKGANE